MNRIKISFLISLITFLPLFADQYYLPEGDYQVNVPVLWNLYDTTDLSEISFIDDEQRTIMQVSWYEGSQFDQVSDMYRFFADGIGAQGEQSHFSYLEWNAILADLTFSSGPQEYRGWFLFLEGESYDYQVMVFSPLEDYEIAFPVFLSCLDSFSPGEESRRHPGVISQMFYNSQGAELEKKTDIIEGKGIVYDYDPFELQASQTVIEREAPLLTKYKSGTPDAALAWDRYYKLIYRDNYHRLDPVYEALKPHMRGKTSEEIALILLSWLQSFEYGSSGTFSDLLSPLASLVKGVGDCDSLALAYLILLEHFDIEGILLVSEIYSHAMAAVDVDGGGFTFTMDQEDYLVAELTKQVGLGMIASDMADPTNWQPISFRGE